MATVIKLEKMITPCDGGLSGRLASALSPAVICEIDNATRTLSVGERIEEIRLRAGRRAYLTVGGGGMKRNLALSVVPGGRELSEMLDRLCDGSLYAYSESIIKGYVSLGDGVRVGVCGRASVEQGKILGIYDISALNIRLPCRSVKLDEKLVAAVRSEALCGRGTLIYSPPGEGKTTMLRSLVAELAGGDRPMRIALVDTRDEMSGFDGRTDLSVDILGGYPKSQGIRIATAFMNPQAVMCDEIGDDEADAIAEAQNCGVGLIATAHGSDVEGILRRSGMLHLHRACSFGLYVGIRINTHGGFDCRIQKREETVFADTGNDRGMY